MYKQGLHSFLADFLPVADLSLLKGPSEYAIAPKMVTQQYWQQRLQGYEVLSYQPPVHSSATRTSTAPAKHPAATTAPGADVPAPQPRSLVMHAAHTIPVFYPPSAAAAVQHAYSYPVVAPGQLYHTAAGYQYRYPPVAAGHGYVQYMTSSHQGYGAPYAAGGYPAVPVQLAPPAYAAGGYPTAPVQPAPPAYAAAGYPTAPAPPAAPPGPGPVAAGKGVTSDRCHSVTDAVTAPAAAAASVPVAPKPPAHSSSGGEADGLSAAAEPTATPAPAGNQGAPAAAASIAAETP